MLHTHAMFAIFQARAFRKQVRIKGDAKIADAVAYCLMSCRPEARMVARKIVRLGLGLGIITGISLTASGGFLPKLFTTDKGVLSAVAVVFPW